MKPFRSHRVTGPRAQWGQALIWMMGTLATAVAVLYGVYNVAQVTNGKEKAVNAADAAALAGSTAEARMLNLMAYNNRAMMANEAFLAQLSALESWLGYVSTTGENVGKILDLIPYLEELGVLLQEAGEMAQEGQTAIGEAIDVAVIPALEVSKTTFHLAHAALADFGGLVAQDAASKIVAANNATFNAHKDAGVSIDNSAGVLALTMTKNNTAWIGFTKYYDGNGRADAKEVLLNSRDDFTTTRNGHDLPIWNFDWVVLGGDKRGGSKLVDYTRWEHEDDYELWTWDGKTTYYPIGWGRSNIAKNSSSGNRWGSHAVNARAYAAGKNHSGWSGVPSIYDTADKKKADLATLSIDYFVAVKRAQPANLTTQELKMQKVHSTSRLGSPEMNERLQSNQVAALGKAHVFFERPKAGLKNDWTAPAGLARPDSAKEYGSLFSPYWQARLTDYTQKEKGLMYAAMGIDPILAPLTPGGH
jgi:hypothetical protein